MLILLHRQGIRPDAILFADTGGEKPETYEYLDIINLWCGSVGFPIVQRLSKGGKHDSLEANCLANLTLPSLAYGGKGCSLKWKGAVMDREVNNWAPAGMSRACGMPVVRAIGYDAGPADSRRSRIAEDVGNVYLYPLRDAGWTREDCIRTITEAGLPQPGKSACFFCPAMKKSEILDLLDRHPDLVARALKMEAVASLRGYSKSTKGLGRAWNWRDYLEEKHHDRLAALAARYDIGQELLPLRTAVQQTLWDTAAPAVATPAASGIDRMLGRWLSVGQIMQAVGMPIREAAAAVRRAVEHGMVDCESFQEHGITLPLFRSRDDRPWREVLAA
jgi:hypothetical protein